MNHILHECRSGEFLTLPPGFDTRKWDGTSIRWYDTGQEHIVTNAIFRNCGLRREGEFDEYDQSSTRGCPDDHSNSGCDNDSSVWKTNSVSLHSKILMRLIQSKTEREQ